MDNIFGNRFYGFGKGGWHGKGITDDTPHGAVETYGMLTPYWFEKRPVSFILNGEPSIHGYAIVRSPLPDDPQERDMGSVEKNYNIVQPLTICELFDENVKQPVETLGCLGKGEKLFLTWKLPSIQVGTKDNDEVNLYGFVAGGFDGLFGVSLMLTSIRVVCQNTFMMAIAEAENSKDKEKNARIWSGKHNSHNLERDLGIWLAHVQEKAEEKANSASVIFNEMVKVAVNDELAKSLFAKVYPNPKALPADYPQKLRGEKQAVIDEGVEKAERDRNMVWKLWDGAGTAIDHNLWGLFNCVTEAENHVRVEKKPAAESVVIGNRAKTMAKAFGVVTSYMQNGGK